LGYCARVPAPSFQTTDDDAQRRAQPGAGATAAWLFRVLECEQPLSLPARACLHGVDEVAIGRGSETGGELHDRKLTVVGADHFLSSAHTRLRRRSDRWLLEDAGSRNGTFIGRQRVKRHELADGDLFEAGHTFFLFRESLPRADAAPAWLEARDLRPEAGLLTLQPKLEAAFAQLRAVAPSKLPLLIAGETGTGKELAATAAHLLSGRTGPLQHIKCAAVEPALLEAQLFGGATQGAQGALRGAEGGTLFLDEIGELPLPAQALLLRALQQSEGTQAGGSQAPRFDLRLIAATHEDLSARVQAGAFRADLLARLKGFVLELPPLRERREDLGLLVALLLRRHANAAQGVTLLPESARALFAHRWPLNVRELGQAVATALLLAKGAPIGPEHLPAVKTQTVFETGAVIATQTAAPKPSLFQDLKRRRVFRTLVTYGVVAFAILQVIEPIMHALHWPDAVLTYTVFALTAGFPLTALLSWAYDLRAGRILRAAPTGGLRGARLAALLFALGVLAAVPGLLWYFLLRRA